MSELNKESVEQAGGDERAALQELIRVRDWVKNRRGQPEKLKNTGQTYIMIEKCETLDMLEWAIERARAALAQPSPKCATCNGTGLIDDGEITCSEGGIPYENGPVKCVKDCPACKAQPSPKCVKCGGTGEADSGGVHPWGEPVLIPYDCETEQAEAERPEVAEVAFVLRNIGAMDAEDIDGDNVDLRFEDAEGRDTGCDVSIVEYAEKAADLFEQHDRIVGALRADRDSWAEQAEQRLADWDEMRKERDAALAEVERLRESKGDPVGSLEKCMKVMYERDEHAKRLEVALARVAELEGKLTDWVHEGFRLNEALAVAKAQHSVPDDDMILQIFADNAEHSEQGDEHGYCIVREQHAQAIARKLLAAAPGNSAQHSVPEEFIGRLSEFLAQRGATGKALLRELRDMLAAAPVCRLSRSALTDAQMRRLYENSTEAEKEHLGFAAFARLMRLAEAVHQIAAAPAQGGE
ncbi:TPA: hypothetical protein ACWMHB_001522 [Pseudomonas aeruginosa]|nr:hypothetical protein [Pseudomonas aeruginosa]